MRIGSKTFGATLAASAPFLLASLLFFSSCDNRVAGAVGTGNAGRIIGKIVCPPGISPLGFTVRLVLAGDASRFVDSTRNDSTGDFQFGDEPPGSYRVEVWRNGIAWGSSSIFKVDGDVTGLLVVLVDGTSQVSLDLSSLGNVDSVYVDYRENVGVKVGNLWLIQSNRDSGYILHTHVGNTPGRWDEWRVVIRDGQTTFINLANNQTLAFGIQVDTGTYLLTPHTVGLWDFDSLYPDGIVHDRSPYGNDLAALGTVQLQPSPHGKALAELFGSPLAVDNGGTVAPSLRWSRTGTMTYELRFRLDSIPLGGMIVLGSYSGVTFWVKNSRQLAVDVQTQEPGKNPAWGEVVTDPGKIPVGKWVDLEVSIDGPLNQIYVWIDDVAQPVYSSTDWPVDATIYPSTLGDFEVGGGDWDPRASNFTLDELRISDTLVFGRGLARQASVELNVPSQASEAVAIRENGTCVGCKTVEIGRNLATATLGGFAWRPSIPRTLLGTHIANANLEMWPSKGNVGRTSIYQIHRILSGWSPSDPPSSWFAQGSSSWNDRVAAAPFATAPMRSVGSGGVVFDVTEIVQAWIDDTTTNHGILVQAADPAREGDTFIGAGAPDSLGHQIRIVVRYR